MGTVAFYVLVLYLFEGLLGEVNTLSLFFFHKQ